VSPPPTTPSAAQPFARLRTDLLPLLLVTLGIGYPVARQVLPGTARPALLLPLALLLLWFLWRLRQPPATVRSPAGGALLLAAAALAASAVGAVAEPATVVAQLFHWGAVAILLFLTIDMLAHGWQPRLFLNGVLLTSSLGLLHASWTIAGWWLQWVWLWQPGEQLFPVGFRQPLINTQPNQAALIINLGVPLAIAAMWRAEQRWHQGVWGVWLLLATVVQFHTSSRGGWLAMGVVTAAMLVPLLWSVLRGKRWRRLGTTIALAGGYSALFITLFLFSFSEIVAHRTSPSVAVPDSRSATATPATPASTPTPAAPAATATPASEQDSGAGSIALKSLTHSTGRTLFWSRAVQFFREQPLTGVGPAGYSFRYASLEPSSRVFRAPHAHSLYVTLLSEAGVLGVAGAVVLLLAVAWLWWRGWQRLLPPTQPARFTINAPRLVLLSAGAALLGVLAHGVVEVPLIATFGIALYTAAAGLGAAHCWQRSEHAWHLRAGGLTLQPLHVVLVALAVLAWGCSFLVLQQQGQWERLRAEGAAAAQQGNLEDALHHYTQAIERYPQGGAAYSGQATTLAWQALRDPSEPALLQRALQAQQAALQHDPTNHYAPLNHAMLLAEMGNRTAAINALEQRYAEDTTRWWLTSLLLARLYEQAGDSEQAQHYWKRTLQRSAEEPFVADSVACMQSDICAAMEPMNNRYAALVEARQLAAAPDAQALQRIRLLADSWNSVNMWAVGVQAAERMGNAQEAQRFRAAALDQATIVGQRVTKQLAIVLLEDAMQRNDRAAMRRLLQQWPPPPDMRILPQISRLLVTTTDSALAETAYAAALQLGDDTLLQRATHYRAFVEGAP
jgi:O-antigen ligase